MFYKISFTVIAMIFCFSPAVAFGGATGVYENDKWRIAIGLYYNTESYSIDIVPKTDDDKLKKLCTYYALGKRDVSKNPKQGTFTPDSATDGYKAGNAIRVNYDSDALEILPPNFICGDISLGGVYEKTAELQSVLFKGQSEGILSSVEEGDVFGVNILKDKQEHFLKIDFGDDYMKYQEVLYSIAPGTPVSFDFNVEQNIMDWQVGSCFSTQIVMTKIKLIKALSN